MALEISNNRDKQKSDRDLSIFAACKKFEEMHPKEKQPEWLKYCMSMRTMRNHNKNWVIKMILLSVHTTQEFSGHQELIYGA